jgi:hypothetical protein
MKQIRFLMELYQFSGMPEAWKIPNYSFYNCQNSPFSNLESHNQNDIQDTGFGSRLHFWHHGFLIGRFTGWNYKIVYCLDQYPETYFLKFPKTYFMSKEKFLTGIGHFRHVDNGMFNRLLNREFASYELSDLMFINSAPIGTGYYPYGKNPLSLITLHYDGLRVDLENVFKKYVGVHVRRYYGINWTEDDLNHLTPSQKEDFIKYCPWKSVSDTWKYIPDDVYLREMKKYSHDTVFYVSTDLPDRYYLKYWKSVLPGRVVTRHDIIDEVKEIFVRYYGDEILKKPKKYKMLYQMLDWFVLLYCREILILKPITAPAISAFSETALKIGTASANIVTV